MNSTFPIDLDWTGHSRSIASALLLSENSAALVDPGPASTVANLRKGLAHHGVNISDLHAIFLTHIHLDHAAATGELVRENPRLKVYVHSRGAGHMIDPSKLLQSAARLYGDSMERQFGVFLPVPADNLQVLEGGETILLGSRQLRVLYTPGHASHHLTYFDSRESLAFVGDTTGIAVNGHPFVLPVTPPPDISIELWDASLDTIAALHPNKLFLTHFSFSGQPDTHIATYRDRLHRWRDLSAAIFARNLDDVAATHQFAKEIAAEAAQFLSPDEISHYLFNGALHLSWLGLARYHRKRAEAATSPAPS